jgi:hypothetical protein
MGRLSACRMDGCMSMLAGPSDIVFDLLLTNKQVQVYYEFVKN